MNVAIDDAVIFIGVLVCMCVFSVELCVFV